MTVMDALVAAWEQNPEATESMIDDVVSDLLADEALDSDSLNRLAAAYVSQRTAIAKRALLRQYASDVARGHYPDDEVHKAAEWLSGLEAFALEAADAVRKNAEFERKHKRGLGGRFVRGVSQTKKIDYSGRAPAQQAVPVRNKLAGTPPPAGGYEEEVETRLRRTQAQYEQANEILSEFGGAFSAAERSQIDAIIQYSDANGDVKMLAFPLEEVRNGLPESAYAAGKLDPDSDILSIQVDAGENADPALLRQVNRFNAAGAAGGTQFAALMAMDEGKRTAFTQSLMPRGPEQSRLQSMFGRFKAGGDVLEATGQPKMAELARFMGTYGEEANKIMDPRVRQAAYRYRGTEKEPDVLLMRQMNSPDMNLVDAVARQQGEGPLAEQLLDQGDIGGVGRRGRPDRPKQYGPVEGTLRHNLRRSRSEGEPLTEDQLKMRVRSDLAAMHLMRTIPLNRKVAELSQKSGNILPSQGVLIDADGDVVSQAVGFGDDTYLPFDYGNIKRRMRGGQYVRTRVQGGLTGEDIAAAVNGGARMATVVSSSGVHSIEFDPNLRGTRGGSDKARAMYRRYIQILDAVEGSGMYEQDIDPREKARLRTQAAEISGTHDPENPDFKASYRKLESEARAKASSLSEEEMDGLMDQATQMVISQGGGGSTQQTQQQIHDVYEELESKATAAKASKLRLNAEGYRVALETLQQQFPYFIRSVNYEPLAGKDGEPGFLDSRGQQPTPGSVRQRLRATDEGYVRPGGIKAASTQTGFYATQGAHQNKREAMAARQAEGGGGAPPGGPGVTPGGPEGGLSASVSRLRNQAQVERNQNLTELQNVFSTLGAQRVSLRNHPAGQPWEQVAAADNGTVASWFLNQENPRAALEDPAKAQRLATALSDRKAVAGAFNIALQSGAGQDFFAGGGSFGGRRDAQSAADYVSDLASKIVDADLVTQPFVAPQGSPEGDPFHVGQRPQALSIKGAPVNNITNTAQLNAFIQQNPEIAAIAQRLGNQPGGDGRKPAAAVSQDVSEQVAVLRDLGQIIADAKSDPDRRTGLKRGAGLYIGARSTNPQKFIETLTRMNDGTKVDSAEDLIALERKWPDTRAQALKLQQAWALVNAGRAVEMIEGGGVGTGPKAVGKALQPHQQSPQAASTRPGRPSLEVVRKNDSPLSREISRRRLAGKPFVPLRAG